MCVCCNHTFNDDSGSLVNWEIDLVRNNVMSLQLRYRLHSVKYNNHFEHYFLNTLKAVGSQLDLYTVPLLMEQIVWNLYYITSPVISIVASDGLSTILPPGSLTGLKLTENISTPVSTITGTVTHSSHSPTSNVNTAVKSPP